MPNWSSETEICRSTLNRVTCEKSTGWCYKFIGLMTLRIGAFLKLARKNSRVDNPACSQVFSDWVWEDSRTAIKLNQRPR